MRFNLIAAFGIAAATLAGCVAPVPMTGPAVPTAPGVAPAPTVLDTLALARTVFRRDEVREALSSLGVQGITVTEVKGFGRQKGHTELYRGAEYVVDFLPKVKIDVAIADDQLDRVIEAITKAANTGKIGDGKIFVVNLEQAICIRTGETDTDAI